MEHDGFRYLEALDVGMADFVRCWSNQGHNPGELAAPVYYLLPIRRINQRPFVSHVNADK